MTRSALQFHLLNALHSLGVFGPWAMIPIYAVAITLFIPIPILGFAAGAMFGVWLGFLVLTFSTMISAGLVFMAGRHFTRGWVYKKIEASPKVHAVDDAVTKGGWKMVALLRQTSVLPFSVMNYGLGLSKIPFWDYMAATGLSMMPGSLLYAYSGHLAGEIFFNGHKPQRTILEWVFLAVGIVFTIGTGLYATKRVKKILYHPC